MRIIVIANAIFLGVDSADAPFSISKVPIANNADLFKKYLTNPQYHRRNARRNQNANQKKYKRRRKVPTTLVFLDHKALIPP